MASIDPIRIQEHMEVVTFDGTTIGKVDHLQGDKIKLTKNDSPDGQHHMVPLTWVGHVDAKVELNKTLADIKYATGGNGVQETDAVPEPGVTDAVPTRT